MANIQLNTVLQLRNDTEANWLLNSSVVPRKGEACVSIDKGKIKIGDGTTTWQNLKYINATPEELSASGVQNVVVSGNGDILTNAVFEDGVLTITKGTDKDSLYTISAATSSANEATVNLTKSGTGNGTSSSFNISGGGATSVTVSGGKIVVSSTDNNTTYTFAEGTTEGAFSVTPSGSSAQVVKIHGLGTAAYTDSDAYDAAGTGAAAAKAVQGNTTSTVKTVEDAAAAAASAASAAQETADSANELAQTALQNVSVAGKTLTKGSNTISADEIKTAMGLGAAAVKNVDEAISNETSVNLPTTKAVVDKVNNMIAALGNVLEFKGVKTYDEIIAIADAQIGDVWITEDGKEYVCTTAATAGAENWEELGTTVDLSGYLTTEVADDTYATISNLSAHTGDANIHVTSTDKTNWNGKTTMGEVEAKGYQTAAQVKAIKVDNATHADAADNATNLGGQPASYYAPASSIPTVPIQSVVGNNGVTASLAGTTVTVGLNLTDVFVLNGGNAAGTYA